MPAAENDGATAGPTPEPSFAAKVVPPIAGKTLLPRPRLRARLNEALERRLTTIVAGAGFGKSTLLLSWTEDANCAWYTVDRNDRALSAFARGLLDSLRLRVPDLPPDLAAIGRAGGPDAQTDDHGRAHTFAALLCDALGIGLKRDLLLVIDDLHELEPGSPSAALVEDLARQGPPGLHLALASRDDPPFPIERLRGQGHVLALSSGDLALTAEEVRGLTEEVLGTAEDAQAEELHRLTGGWPVAVRLLLEALNEAPPAERPDLIANVERLHGSLFAYLAAEVFEGQAPEVRRLVRAVAQLDSFTPELCRVLVGERAGDDATALARRGLFVEARSSTPGWYSITALMRDFAMAHFPMTDAEVKTLHGRAADWFEERGHIEQALGSARAAQDAETVARLLDEHGEHVLGSGRVDAVLEALEAVPQEMRDPALERLAGEALQIRGDWAGALACFERAAGDAGPVTSDLAWRMGLIYYLRGELDSALATYQRAARDAAAPAEDALLLAWMASAYWMRGELELARRFAVEAGDQATRSRDPKALAAAHTSLAMVAALEGDRTANEAHYIRAIDHAERAGDVLQLARIRTNRGSRLMEEGDYEEALAELGIAIRLANLSGFAAFQGLALTNRGETYFHLGRLEEAHADLQAARKIYQRMGSLREAGPVGTLADIYRERGDFALARTAYAEAIAQSEAGEDLQILVPALVGLARVVMAEDAAAAGRLIDRALAQGSGMGYVAALLGAGWLDLETGRRSAALERARHALSEARARRDRAGAAEALEIEGHASEDQAGALARFDESLELWRAIDNPFGEARVRLARARLLDAAAARSEAEAVRARMTDLGARPYAMDAAALIEDLDRRERPSVLIASLGGFRVARDGEVVPANAWQSKKARDVLKMLVARRGRPTPREVLTEALWPDEAGDAVTKRLSVALATVRGVLDPDKRHPADHFVVADKEAIWLDVSNLPVDVEAFLADVAEGIARLRRGDPSALRLLTRAEAAYLGDFLEEELYEDYAVPLREEARACYIQIARLLAGQASEAGDHDAAVRYLLRVIERDRYDEGSHLSLISALLEAGRHGEARRWYQTYCGRMAELDVEAAAFPGGRRSAAVGEITTSP